MHFVGDEDDVPDFAATRDRTVGYIVSFVRTLRRAGVDVPANASVVAARALVEVGFDDPDRGRAALRSVLVSRAEDVATFEQLFPSFWAQLVEGREQPEHFAPEQGAETPVPSLGAGGEDPPEPGGATGDDPPGDDDRIRSVETTLSVDEVGEAGGDEGGSEDDGADVATAAVYSPTGRSEPIEAAPLGPAREDDLAEPIRRLTDAIAGLRGRRWTRPGDERVDTRRALRRSFGTGGTVLSVPERERQHSAVRAVLLVDVSQSVLDTIDRGFLIRFLRLASATWRDVRVFFFDTSVREVTEAFDAPTSREAVAALERAEAEWGGGTRIGSAIEAIRREHPTAVDRESVAFVISDGLEVGEIDVLESGMSWLSALAGAVLWLNPLAASPDYEPACRGMAAALPYVDGLFAFAGPDDVAEIARQLHQQGLRGRIGYEYDPRRIAADA